MRKTQIKNKQWLLISLLLLITGSILGFNPSVARAETAYRTYTQDGYGNYVETQTGYEPIRTISYVGELSLNRPTDMKLGSNDYIYIADSGNQRIVILNAEGEFEREIKHEAFKYPSGLFVAENGRLYVADESAGTVFVFDEKDELVHQFERPEAVSFGKNATFSPTKLAVDNRENVYVLSRGNNNGIIMLNAETDGEFLGYFAPNIAQQSILTEFRKLIFTEEQLEKMIGTAPTSATNLTIDHRGLIYTVTANETIDDVLKKLNMGGVNLLTSNYIPFPASVAVGNYDNIYVLTENGYIFEYTSEGEFLFLFAGPDAGYQRSGLLGKGSAIAINSANQILTLDETKNEIQLFEPTEFTRTLHNALDLYQDGDYEESKIYWEEILKMNAQFDFANLGIGEAYYRENEFNQAMASFRQAKNIEGYSDSFWEIRNVWLKENMTTIIGCLILLFIVVKVWSYLRRKYGWKTPLGALSQKVRQIKIFQELGFVAYFAKHPIDGAYGIKHEQKTSNLSAIIIYIMALVTFVINKYYAGFIFRTVEDGEYTLINDILIILVVSLFISVATYMISTITDGEATFKETMHGFVYSLGPYILIQWLLLILSNCLTLNEQFIIQFGYVIMMTWVISLMLIAITELNGYRFKETIRTVFLTAFAIFIAAITIFIVYSLMNQLISFIVSIFREVVARFES